jgi:hypothetical protein
VPGHSGPDTVLPYSMAQELRCKQDALALAFALANIVRPIQVVPTSCATRETNKQQGDGRLDQQIVRRFETEETMQRAGLLVPRHVSDRHYKTAYDESMANNRSILQRCGTKVQLEVC